MIVELMQKHRRWITVLMFLFIGIPLALMIPGGGGSSSGPAQFDASFAVARVGSTPVTTQEFFTRYNDVSQQRSRSGFPSSAADLVNDGTVEAILDGLIQEAMIANETSKQPVYPEREYLTTRLQEYTMFQNSAGEFDKGSYNQWVQINIDRGINWDSIYAEVADGVNREVYLELLGASARVLESELRDEFESTRMKLRIKAAAIEPKIELSDEDLRKHYDDNLAAYMTPELRRADFLAVSLKPPRPDIVEELVERARSGEDFAELAREHSQSFDKDDGGDMGWIGEEDSLLEHQSVLFELGVGEISDPSESPAGIYIYKVEEERTNDEGVREFHARQITIRPQLRQEELEARTQRAQDLLSAAVEEGGDLEAVGLLEDVELQSTGLFAVNSTSTNNIPNADTYTFTQAMLSLQVGQLSNVIVGRENLYIGAVMEILEPIQQTFEEAWEDVEKDATDLYKNGPEYFGILAEHVTTIQEDAENIEAIQVLFPELDIEIKETGEFKQADFLFAQGLLFDTRQVFQLLLDKGPGDLAGPIRDLGRVMYFVELVERIPPDEIVWENEWEDERGRLQDAYQFQRRLGRQSDYLLFLTEQASNNALIQKDYSAIFSLLGLDDTGADANDVATPPPLQVFPPVEDLREPEDTLEEIVLDLDEEKQEE